MLAGAPYTLDGVPAWLSSLGFDDFQRAWVAAVIDAAASEKHDVSVSALSSALVYVRDRYRQRYTEPGRHVPAGEARRRVRGPDRRPRKYTADGLARQREAMRWYWELRRQS